MRAAIPIFALCVLACTSPPRAPWQSGRRLHAIVRGTTDSAIRVGWHDVGLDIDCRFVAGDTFDMHCLPMSSVVSGAFIDAACTQPGVVAITLDDGASVAVLLDGYTGALGALGGLGGLAGGLGTLGCDGPRIPHGRLVQVGPAAMGYRMTSSGCIATPEGVRPMLGDAPTNDYVSGTLEHVRVTSRSFQYGIVAADGAEERTSSFDDVQLGTSCTLGAVGVAGALDTLGSSDWCVPSTLAYVSNAYADPSCTTVVAGVGSCGASFAVRGSLSCDPEFYAVGPAATSTFTNVSGTCMPSTAPGMFSSVTPLIASPLVRGTRALRGSGELRVVTLALEDTQVVDIGLADANGVRCSPSVFAAEGVRRCIPDAALVSGTSLLYADASCTAPVWRAYHTTECITLPSRVAVTAASPSYDVTQVVPTTSTSDGPRWMLASTGCSSMVPSTTTAFPYTDMLLGDPIDPSTFPVVRDFVE